MNLNQIAGLLNKEIAKLEKRPKVKRNVRPDDIQPMHHVEEVGGRQEAHVFQNEEGEFEIQTREHVYELPNEGINIHAEGDVIVQVQKMRISRYRPRDITKIFPMCKEDILERWSEGHAD